VPDLEFSGAIKTKVNPSHLATDLLAQAGADRQVLGCGQSAEDNCSVGEIEVFTFSFAQLYLAIRAACW